MYRISELGERVGLSRTALLYYEKLGLISGKRMSNGYRMYSDMDVQRLTLIQQLQNGGLTLKECKACLEAKIEQALLRDRLQQLDAEIAHKQQARDLLAALLGEKPLSGWHEMLDKVAPDAHLAWLKMQGFSDVDAQRLRWLSKDMNTHESYMADFEQVYSPLDRWGPGSEGDTLAALNALPQKPTSVLEIGCGQGIATTVLAEHLPVPITALDNHQGALDRLMERAKELGYAEQVVPAIGDMSELPFTKQSFDLIWAEGCAYIMGVEKALKYWREFLTPQGLLVVSDIVWSSDTPSEEAAQFWASGYPDMQTVTERIKQIEASGYRVIKHFALSDQAWQNYYQPLQQRANELKTQLIGSQALIDIQAELDIFYHHKPEFDYQMFVLAKA